MPFVKPTLPQINDRIKGDIRTEVGIPTLLRRSVEAVFARAIAGVAYLIYGFIEFISKQVFVDTAEVEFLERHAAIYGIQRKVATFEEFTVRFTGLAGSTVNAGTLIQRVDGAQYTTDSLGTIPAFVAGVAAIEKVTTVADVSGSLNSKYFLYNTPSNAYVFYISVNAMGIDPILPGRTSVLVSVATNASANTIATALQVAANALPDASAIVSTNQVTITADSVGAAAATADGTAPTGFTFTHLTPGVTQVELQVDVPCTAVVSGALQSVLVDDVLSLLSPISGIESDCTVVSIQTEAEDTELDEPLRARVLARIQTPPLGGSYSDYVNETLKVPGVVRAWVTPQYSGYNSVGVSFVLAGNEIPDGPKIAEVQAALEVWVPITVDLIVFAPVAYPINPTIAINPNTPDVRAAIIAELQDLLVSEANVRGAYAGYLETFDGTVLLSHIDESISVASGEADHSLTLPVANVTPDVDGKLVTLGTITWTTL